MSNLTKFLSSNLLNGKFKLVAGSNAATLECGNISMFWTNFSGKPNQWGNDARTFNLAITDDVVNWFKEAGLAVRIHEVGGKVNEETGEQEDLIKYINVKVQMTGPFPPVVKLFTEYRGEKSITDLNEDTISVLDHCKIISADCILRISESKKNPGHYVCYLKKLYVIHEKRVEFDGKYDDWEDENTPTPIAPDDAEDNDN